MRWPLTALSQRNSLSLKGPAAGPLRSDRRDHLDDDHPFWAAPGTFCGTCAGRWQAWCDGCCGFDGCDDCLGTTRKPCQVLRR